MKFVEAPKQRIVFFKALAKAESGIQNDAIALDSRHYGGVGALAEFSLHEHNHIGHCGE